MAANFEPATEDLLALARKLIEEYHPSLKHVRIGFLFRSEPGKSYGRDVYGATSKVSAKLEVVTGLDFVIWVAQDYWEQRPDIFRRALLDHQLNHCGESEGGEPAIRPHDIEEFADVVVRWGLWTLEVASFVKAAQDAPAIQGVLPEFGEKAEREGGVFAAPVDVVTAMNGGG